jgi:glutaredoxin 3
MAQPKIIIYTKDYCPYCMRAKMLLAARNLTYDEIDITTDTTLQSEMIEKANGKKTVPQIFIGDIHIGGFDDLKEKHDSGELDTILKL